MSRVLSVSAVLAAAALVLGWPCSAAARLLRPGESVDVDYRHDYITTEQTDRLVLVDQQSDSFAIFASAPDPLTFEDGSTSSLICSGTLDQKVLRDPATRRLWFLYDFQGGSDLEEVDANIGNFGRGLTDMFVGEFRVTEVSRSADGQSVGTFVESGVSTLPSVLVGTNATSFDRNGSATVGVGDEFTLIDPTIHQEYDYIFLTGGQDFSTFEPAGAATAIPLPAAVPTTVVCVALLCLARLVKVRARAAVA